ncbi:dienelactone hydrolase family protein, partial [Vibrio sp.]|nr:dienelactone hydrolase family protein [Vibrio sp.]
VTMSIIKKCLSILLMFTFSSVAFAHYENPSNHFGKGFGTDGVEISFIEFDSIDLENDSAPLTIQGKLQIPQQKKCHGYKCKRNKLMPAVVILHGSAGVDARGDFYAQSLNEAGIATLEIDMWDARGITQISDRPALPLYTYPDAFAALNYLSQRSEIDPDKIGVMGFSWGGIVTMATAVEANAQTYGGGMHFAAHVAHYPVCFAYNSSLPGSDFYNLTGAPILVQIGENDDYDLGSGPCEAVRASLTTDEQANFSIVSFAGAYHDFDRLRVPTSVYDPYANFGAGGQVRLIPDVDAAYQARRNAVKFFVKALF